MRTIVTTIARKPTLVAGCTPPDGIVDNHVYIVRAPIGSPDQRQIDGPHMPDDGDPVDLVADVAPDRTVPDRILVETPEQLGFDL